MKQEEKEREFAFKNTDWEHTNEDRNKNVNGKRLIFCDFATDLTAMVIPDISSDDDILMELHDEMERKSWVNTNLFGKEIADECGQDHYYLMVDDRQDEVDKVVEKKKDMTLNDIMSYNEGCKICLEFTNN